MQTQKNSVEIPVGDKNEAVFLYKTDENEPVAIRKLHPSSTEDSQAYSLMNEDPRVIYGLSGRSSTKDIDEEMRQGEDVGTETMSPVLGLAIIGDSGVPEKYRGKVLGWMEFLHDDPAYWKKHGFFDYPDDTLLLDVIYSRKFFTWREDLNTKDMLGDLPTKRASKTRKDLWFARQIGEDENYSDSELKNVMVSGVRQGIQLVIEMEKRLSKFDTTVAGQKYPKSPRKIVFVASVKQGNVPSNKLLEELGFSKNAKRGKEDGEFFDIWSLEI